MWCLKNLSKYSVGLCIKNVINVPQQRKASLISAILQDPQIDDVTEIKGWVKNLRIMKNVVFADVNDGSCSEKLQIVVPKELNIDSLTYGSSVQITGKLAKTPKGQLEMVAQEINVLGECVVLDGYPFNPRTQYPPEYSRQYLHLRSRTNYFSSVLRVRNTMLKSIYDYFAERNYLNINTPILTSNDCEGAGELFKVLPDNEKTLQIMKQEGKDKDSTYFGTKTFLSVSGQLHLESICRSLGNVYTLGPTFRAENSKSRLHLSEFYMLEGELAFCESLEELQTVIEDLIKCITKEIYSKNSTDLVTIDKNNKREPPWLTKQFPVMSYDEAKSSLYKKGVPSTEVGLNKEQELELVKHCNDTPVFVVRWPKKLKSFYMKECKHDNNKVEALDLLAPITGEIVGGSLREDNYEKLKAKLPSEQLNWYLELRKFGNIPTGGFGLGVERLLQVLCAVNNIKDTLPFPRWPHNCYM